MDVYSNTEYIHMYIYLIHIYINTHTYACAYCTSKASWSFSQALPSILVFSGLLTARRLFAGRALGQLCCQSQSEVLEGKHKMGLVYKSLEMQSQSKPPTSVPIKHLFSLLLTQRGEYLS